MPTRNPDKHKIVRDYLSAVSSVVNVWTNPTDPGSLKETYIGLVLAEAYYTTNQWVSAQYIVSRVGCLSIDTARRTLEDMIDQGLVEFTELDGRKRVYRATVKTAEATVRALAA